MLIFCCGMLRSGSTLQYQLTVEIIEKAGLGAGLGWIESVEQANLLSSCQAGSDFRVIKCHNYSKEIAELCLCGDALAIYVYRDIRDVVVSLMHKNGITFNEAMQSNCIEQLIDQHAKWTTVKNLYVSRYEVMIDDLSSEVRRIAKHLGIDVDEATARSIAEKYSLDEQKLRMHNLDSIDVFVKAGINSFDPKSLLHKNHIYSGAVGQWRYELTSLQVGLIEDVAHSWLKQYGYRSSKSFFIRKYSYGRHQIIRKVNRLYRHLFLQTRDRLISKIKNETF